MSYVMVLLVLATLFGMAVAIFIAAFLIHLCRSEKAARSPIAWRADSQPKNAHRPRRA